MQVEQIDREAAAPFMPYLVLDISETSFAQAFARHRHQARAEVVGEIVAMLDERISVYEQKRDKADPLADETYNRHEAITYVLEALQIVKLGMGKFGGRDAD